MITTSTPSRDVWNATKRTREVYPRIVVVLTVFFLALLTVSSQSSHAEGVKGSVYLPCPPHKAGNYWKYKTVLPGFVEIREEIVLSSKDDKVLVGGKIRTEMASVHAGPFLIAPTVLASEAEYERKGKTTFLRYQTHGDVEMHYDPATPFCGELPSRTNIGDLTDTPAMDASSEETITYTALGEEKVTVPAGTFNAKVVEKIVKVDAESPGEQWGLTDEYTLIYAVEGVGIVKMMSKVKTAGMQSQGAPDPQIGALMQEAIDKMQRGEDVNEVMNQMEVASQKVRSSGASANVQNQASVIETRLVTELQSYRVEP